jgi:hypothetical protein
LPRPHFSMKKFKKIIRRVSYVLFLVLAVTGMGIAGAAPVATKRQEDFVDTEITIEMVDKQSESVETNEKDVLF